MKPTIIGLYIATNLNYNFHYQVLPKDYSIIEDMERFCRMHKAKQFRMIDSTETFHDANLTVINDPMHEIINFIDGINDSVLIQKLVDEGSLDSKRRNIKIDTGFECGQ
jgi:hypothetical protein